MSEPLEVQQNTQFQLDLKTLIGLLAGFISIAGVYFTLTSELAQLQLDNIRIQSSVLLNEEFRIKWPRGELDNRCLRASITARFVALCQAYRG